MFSTYTYSTEELGKIYIQNFKFYKKFLCQMIITEINAFVLT